MKLFNSCAMGGLLTVLVYGNSCNAQESTLVALAETGSRLERVNIVMLSEGYSSAELSAGKFDRDAVGIAEALLSTEPYKSYRDYFNIYGVRVNSAQSGADFGSQGGLRDTYFQASFNTAGIDRYLTISTEGYFRAITLLNRHVPEHDIVLIVVNDSKYGGAGGSIAVTSTNPSAAEIAIHEIGHSFARLTDEYDYAGGGAWDAPNVTTQTSLPLLKWRGWVNSATATPTPQTWDNGGGKVGLFEGAAYQPTGYYRPTLDSKMKTLGEPFYAVNEEAIVLSIYRTISPITSSFPVSSELIASAPGQMLSFSVAGPSPAGAATLRVDWFVDDQLQTSSASRDFSISAADLGNGIHRVLAKVSDTTAKVRNDPSGLLQDERSWTLNVSHQGPAAPLNLTGQRLADGTVALNWLDASTDESAFVVERSLGSATFTEVARLTANATMFIDDSVTWLENASYRVRGEASSLLGKASQTIYLPGHTAPRVLAGPTSRALSEGSALELAVVAEGDGLLFQWYRDDVALNFAQSAVLRILEAGLADAGIYHCVVRNEFGETLSSSAVVSVAKMSDNTDVNLSIDLIKNINIRVSGHCATTFLSPGAVHFAAKGLPKGLRVDSKTGRLQGSASSPGDYLVTVIAHDKSGRSRSANVLLIVAPLEGVGEFQAQVLAAPWNQELGGRADLQVTSTGAVSGRLCLAGGSLAFKGRVVSQNDGWALPTVRLERSVYRLSASYTKAGGLTFSVGTESEASLLPGVKCAQGLQFSLIERPWWAGLGERGLLRTKLSFVSKWGYRFATGGVTWAGLLPDGSAFSGSGRLDETLSKFLVWSPLYRNKGSLVGWSQLAGHEVSNTAGTESQTGTLRWTKGRQGVYFELLGAFAP